MAHTSVPPRYAYIPTAFQHAMLTPRRVGPAHSRGLSRAGSLCGSENWGKIWAAGDLLCNGLLRSQEEGKGSAITRACLRLLMLVLCSSTPPREPRAPLAPVETLCGWLVSAWGQVPSHCLWLGGRAMLVSKKTSKSKTIQWLSLACCHLKGMKVGLTKKQNPNPNPNKTTLLF